MEPRISSVYGSSRIAPANFSRSSATRSCSDADRRSASVSAEQVVASPSRKYLFTGSKWPHVSRFTDARTVAARFATQPATPFRLVLSLRATAPCHTEGEPPTGELRSYFSYLPRADRGPNLELYTCGKQGVPLAPHSSPAITNPSANCCAQEWPPAPILRSALASGGRFISARPSI